MKSESRNAAYDYEFRDVNNEYRTFDKLQRACNHPPDYLRLSNHIERFHKICQKLLKTTKFI